MTTREVAETIIRESVCNHGPGAECSEYHEQDIIDRIDEALRNERERAAKLADGFARRLRTVGPHSVAAGVEVLASEIRSGKESNE